MPRSFCIPGIIFLFCAFVLSFLVSISLPYLDDMDIVRTTFGDGVGVQGAGTGQLRVRHFHFFFGDVAENFPSSSVFG
jgi:hypothetical protein